MLLTLPTELLELLELVLSKLACSSDLLNVARVRPEQHRDTPLIPQPEFTCYL
jgi:hypothetical protein